MSISADLNELLHQLPDLLSWVVPGLLFVFAFRRFKYEERSNEKETISVLNAVSISFFVRYAVIIILSWIPGEWLWGIEKSVWIAICSCFSAFFLGIIFGCVSNLSITKTFSENHLHLTIDSNPFYDLSDKKNGCYVRVYLKQNKDEYIFGAYKNCYNRGNEDWIVIKNPVKISGKQDEEKEINHSNLAHPNVTKLLINSKEIELIEYIYQESEN